MSAGDALADALAAPAPAPPAADLVDPVVVLGAHVRRLERCAGLALIRLRNDPRAVLLDERAVRLACAALGIEVSR